mgnify:CR=1 FL=1
MIDPNEDIGLSEFLEFAPDQKVSDELLGRADYGICILLKPAKNGGDKKDFTARYKLPQQMLEEHGVNGSIEILLDIIRSLMQS